MLNLQVQIHLHWWRILDASLNQTDRPVGEESDWWTISKARTTPAKNPTKVFSQQTLWNGLHFSLCCISHLFEESRIFPKVLWHQVEAEKMAVDAISRHGQFV